MLFFVSPVAFRHRNKVPAPLPFLLFMLTWLYPEKYVLELKETREGICSVVE
jgi:hypothetical protein